MSLKVIIISFFLLQNTLLIAQSGIVTYKNKISPPENFDKLKESNPEKYNGVNLIYRKMKAFKETLTYTLEFSQVKSKFFTNPTLINDNNKMSEMFLVNSEYYFDLTGKKRFENRTISGRDILVNEKPINWNLSKETKTINGYKCQKANAIQLFYSVDIETGKTTTKEQPIEAWFTTEIPFSFGPENYGGLPGLILELNTQGNNYSVNTIEIKSTQSAIIKFPDAKNAISDKEAAKKIHDVYNKMLEW